MPNIANLDTAALDTPAKFLRAMKEAGADFTGPMQDPVQRANLVDFLKQGCPKVVVPLIAKQPPLLEGMDFVRTVLGDSLISPEDMTKAYDFVYTKDQLAHFIETLPDLDTVLWLREYGYVLIAGPCGDANLLDVRDFDRKLFHIGLSSWYFEPHEKFAWTDVVVGGEWFAFSKRGMSNALREEWETQERLVTSPEYISNIAEASYAATVYKKVRGSNFLQQHHVRTSSVAANGQHVSVGSSDNAGFEIRCFPNTNKSIDLGAAVARKLKRGSLKA